jgi:hypothetical protein
MRMSEWFLHGNKIVGVRASPRSRHATMLISGPADAGMQSIQHHRGFKFDFCVVGP